MAGYSLTVIPREGESFLLNYQRMKVLVGRRTGETPEGVVIERLHKMNLTNSYTLRVRTQGRIRLFRLKDYFITRPTRAMQQAGSSVTIGVSYGEWRDYKVYPPALRAWESDVVATTSKALGERIPHKVVFAAIRMFGEIWATRGTIVLDDPPP